MSDDMIWDFGFTAVTEQELEAVQLTTTKLEDVSEDLQSLQSRLDRLYNAIQPLLNNLAANPEKEYILWPNRLQKIEQFSDYIHSIYQGPEQ